MLTDCILSMKGSTCNQTLLVYQDMTKKTTFYERNLREITQVKCKIGLWFLSSALPLIYIYVGTKFNFNPFCIFQDMTKTLVLNKIRVGQTTTLEHG